LFLLGQARHNPPVSRAAAPTLRAQLDPALSARIVARQPLLYHVGADARLDRPAHVRAGSALVWLGRELAVVQDDALFIALVEPESGRARPLALPHAAGGVRLFDDSRGNKADKLDLESAVVLGGCLFALGSGSTPARERVVVVREPRAEPRAEILPAHALYAALRAEPEFSGSELNLEGAALVGDDVMLFQRGNGRARGDLLPVDASARVGADRLARYLLSGERAPLPRLEAVTRFELGAIGAIRLTFTDAAARGEQVLYLAAAEDSPDTVRDGAVAGSAVGLIEPAGPVRYTLIRDENGDLFREKPEGLALDPADPSRAYVVLDPDDAALPAELCRLRLQGFA
jgi:hypothetical protein